MITCNFPPLSLSLPSLGEERAFSCSLSLSLSLLLRRRRQKVTGNNFRPLLAFPRIPPPRLYPPTALTSSFLSRAPSLIPAPLLGVRKAWRSEEEESLLLFVFWLDRLSVFRTPSHFPKLAF